MLQGVDALAATNTGMQNASFYECVYVDVSLFLDSNSAIFSKNVLSF